MYKFHTREQLERMPMRLLRSVDIRNGDEEKLVQEVVNKRLRALPPEGTVYRGDVPDIRDGESEKHWQEVIDQRTAKLKARLDMGAEDIETPAVENEIIPPVETTETIVDEGVVENPIDTPTAPSEELSAKFCDSCNGVRKHKVYCVKK